jgi:hypothetical protein
VYELQLGERRGASLHEVRKGAKQAGEALGPLRMAARRMQPPEAGMADQRQHDGDASRLPGCADALRFP